MSSNKYLVRGMPFLILGALLFSVLFVSKFLPVRADTQYSQFSIKDQRFLKGGFKMVGNTNVTCDETVASGNPPYSSQCALARNYDGSVTSGGQRNNGQTMKYIDIDGDSSTVNSSSADLVLPSGSTVRYARLFWQIHGQTTGSRPGSLQLNRMKLKADNQSYQNIVSDATQPGNQWSTSEDVQYSADVTSYVNSHGAGTYFGADVPAKEGGSEIASGWSLYVVYENPAEPSRLVTLFDGNVLVEPGSTHTTISLSGFRPEDQSGVADAKFGLLTWDSDKGPSTPGNLTNDRLFVNNQAANVVTSGNNDRTSMDMFVSNLTDEDQDLITNRNPSYRNTFGMDIFQLKQTIPANSNSLTFSARAASGTDDFFWLDYAAVQVDIIEPKVELTKTASSNANPSTPGSQIDYELTMNVTDAPVINARIEDAIPLGTTYVPGSLEIVEDQANTANVGSKTDAAGDDTGHLDESGNKKVVFYVGNGATATAGGAIAEGETVKVKFSVTVDVDSQDESEQCPAILNDSFFNQGEGNGSNGVDIDKDKKTIDNQANGYFQGGTVSAPFNYPGSPAVSNVTNNQVACLPGAPQTGGSISSAKLVLGTSIAGALGISSYQIKKKGLKKFLLRR